MSNVRRPLCRERFEWEPWGRRSLIVHLAGRAEEITEIGGCTGCSVTAVIVRRERSGDRATSRAVHVAAFDTGEGEPVEAQLLDELRACDGWLPAFSWIAENDGRIEGHGVCTRGWVNDVPCVGLGPIGVVPGSQRAGIGSALMHAMIGAADAVGEPLIALLGDPGYYSQFGFVASTDLGVAPPQTEWGPYFQALALTAWSDSITGQFRYAAPFDNVS